MNLSLFFRNISLFLVLLFCYSCSSGYINYDTKVHNVPFIDASETAKLDFKLSKDEVLNILGPPLYVSKGTNEIQSIVWVYQVRTILTKGHIKEVNNFSLNDNKFIHGKTMGSTNSNSRYLVESRYMGEDFHYLELEFIDNQLINWDSHYNDNNSSSESSSNDDNSNIESSSNYSREYGSVKITKED